MKENGVQQMHMMSMPGIHYVPPATAHMPPLHASVCPEWKPRPLIDSNKLGDQCCK